MLISFTLLLCTIIFSLLNQPLCSRLELSNCKCDHQNLITLEVQSFAKNYSNYPWHKYLSVTTAFNWNYLHDSDVFLQWWVSTLWLSLSHFKVSICHWTELSALYQTETHCWELSEDARAHGLLMTQKGVRRVEVRHFTMSCSSAPVWFSQMSFCTFQHQHLNVMMKQVVLLGTHIWRNKGICKQ